MEWQTRDFAEPFYKVIPMIPLIVKKDEKIVCSKKHDCGSVTEDVRKGDYIKGSVLRIKGGERATKNGHIGHVCYVDGCQEIITRAQEGNFKIRTAQGWIGEFA